MARSGLDHIFVVNTVVGAAKLRTLAALAGTVDLMVAVDEPANAAEVAAAARDAGSTIGVLIEVDTGMDRCGVDTPEAGLALAREIAGLDGISLRGVTGYEGHCALTPQPDLRHERQQAAMALLVATAALLEADGFPCPIRSAGGTVTWSQTAAYPGVTEIQAGTYVLMDTFHGAMVGGFEHALSVQATVISRQSGRVIIDAGSKSIADGELAVIVGHPMPVFRFDEEHGIFDATAGSSLRTGDSVAVLPGYAPSTVNWFDAFHVVEDDTVIDVWPVIPRGPGHHGLAQA